LDADKKHRDKKIDQQKDSHKQPRNPPENSDVLEHKIETKHDHKNQKEVTDPTTGKQVSRSLIVYASGS
jgi:hypothetical protein